MAIDPYLKTTIYKISIPLQKHGKINEAIQFIDDYFAKHGKTDKDLVRRKKELEGLRKSSR